MMETPDHDVDALLKGVWPALATPLTEQEEIDRDGLSRVADYCINAGVRGVLVLGSTGEFPAMTEEMRETAIETVVSATAGQVPVLVGCGESGTKRTLLQLKRLDTKTLSAALVALPYYYPIDQAGVRRYYEAIADQSPLPVVIYNFPQMTKITMAADTVGALADHPNIIGVKDSAGNYLGLQQYLTATEGKEFSVMCGNPALGLAAYLHGASGGIFAGASLAPALCVSVYDAFVRGDLKTAVAKQAQATLITRMGSFGANSAVIKFGLERLGICKAFTTSPLGLSGGSDVPASILQWMADLGLDGVATSV